MKRILILEDDRLLAKTLLSGLASLRAQLHLVFTIQDFCQFIEKTPVQVCVMDRMIDSEDSLETVRYLHDVFPEIKVLLLTKKSAAVERIHGLEAGAHDYLPKPFSLAELRLRVKLLLAQHHSVQEEAEVSLGEVVFVPNQGVIRTKDALVYLRPRENEILCCLSKSIGYFVSRQKITHSLWPESYTPHPSTVDVYVRRLRQKLGEHRSIIQTRRGFGYRLTPFYRNSKSNSGTPSLLRAK